MKAWARAFYKSKAWQKTREAYIAARHGLCERCGAVTAMTTTKLTPTASTSPRWSETSCGPFLELLCQECHNLEHHERAPVAEGLRFTADGDLIAVR